MWFGKLPVYETLARFDKSALFVNTSTKEGEGFPNTFIQAWLRGVPVLSLDVDPDGVVKKQHLGHIAESLHEILITINFYKTKIDKYEQLSKRVRNYSRSHYSIERMTAMFLKTILE